MAGTSRDLSEDLRDDESDPFYTSDDEDDEDYVPEFEEESEIYNSEESDLEFVDDEMRCAVISQPAIALFSKDKQIEYSKDPLPSGRPTVSSTLNTGPTVFARARITDVVSTFLLFMEPIEKIIVEMTNLYGLGKYKDKWHYVDIVEMRAFYGLLLLAGVYRSRGECVTELWNDSNGRPIFRATMSLMRFKEINRCIRFDNREERIATRSRDKLGPIRHILEKWVTRLKILYLPGKFLTVDEQLIPYRGRSPFTQYIPSKPHRYGIKAWVLCDAETYYAYNFQIYVGRDRNCRPEINQGKRVVLELTEDLNGRNVTCDNFFTSRELAIELKKRQMTIVGTIRKNRKEIPPILLDMKNKPETYSEFVFDRSIRATMVSYVPKRRRFVTLLSTFHTKKEIDNTDKKKPEIINFYNSTKGGVDVLDEMVGTYRCKRKVNRWPVAVFANMIDISACNSLAIFLSLNPTWNYTKKAYRRRLFLIELGNSLVHPYMQHRATLPRGDNALYALNEVQMIPSTSVAESSSDDISHAPPTKKRARCYLCAKSPKANVHSVRCDKCIKPVCPRHRFIFCEKCKTTR